MTDSISSQATDSKTMGTTEVVIPVGSSQSTQDVEKALPPPPQRFSKRFWEKGDPEMARARKIYFKAFFSGLTMVIVTIFLVFSIYWGSLWKVPDHSLKGWIVDFDGGEVGQAVIAGLTATRERVVKWDIMPSSDFPRGPVDVQHGLKEDQAWVAIVINEGATTNLQDALSAPDASYNGSAAITAYGVEARNENAYRNFIRPLIQTDLDRVKLDFAMQLASFTLSSSPDLATLLSTSPQTVVNPISYTIINLLPFNQPVASAVAFVGLIYLLILSFFIVMITHGAREASGINKILRFRSLVLVRLASSFFGYFMLSFFYSLLNLAFKLDLTRRYGHAGFVLFWMLNWVGMLSVGLALESLITLLTPQFIPFFMILWIIVNVSVCVFPIDIIPRIYHYGYAAPFYNISVSIRSIAFGTRNTLGTSFGVLLTWVLISCITLPTIQWLIRRKDMKASRGASSPPVDEKRVGQP